MKFGHHRKTPPHIPFISLADIAWQIVIFFLVASSFIVKNALRVDLPAANSNPQQAQKAAETITVQAGETALAVNGQPLKMEELQPRLHKLLEGKKSEQERAVLVSGAPDLSFQRDLDVMYAIQAAGGIVVPVEEK